VQRAPAWSVYPVEKAGKKLLLQVEDIFYIMAKDDYSYLHTDGERYLSTISLAQLERRLDASGFFRVHRRYLVNLDQVKEVVPMYGGTLLLTLKDGDGTRYPSRAGGFRPCERRSDSSVRLDPPATIGVISDTHGTLDRRVLRVFEGVDLLLHAGDIGSAAILTELEAIAPVVAVRGNTDHGAWALQCSSAICAF
jgi:hypothetical protein